MAASAPALRPRDFARLRVTHQLLAGTGPREAVDVVRHLGAMQAQDYGQSLWAIGSRLPGATRTGIEQALSEGRIVRSWPMRGTIHVMAAADVRWLLTLCAPRILAGDARRLTQLELTEADVARAGELVQEAFARRPGLLTRAEMTAAWEAGGIATTGQRGYHLLWRLSQQGLLCIGPMHGKEQTFALLDEWLPDPDPGPPDRDEALIRLAERFATSRGPVTVHDLARWSGLTVADARRGLLAAEPGLQRVTVEEHEYWLPAAAPSPAPRNWGRPLLLAGFDEYLIGYKGRDELIDPTHFARVVPGGNGVFKPMIVVEGRIVGVWSRAVKRDRVEITVHPFEPATLDLAALEPAAEAFRAFLEVAEVTLLSA